MALPAPEGVCLHRVIVCPGCGARGCGLLDCEGHAWDVRYAAGEPPVGRCRSCGADVELSEGLRLIPGLG